MDLIKAFLVLMMNLQLSHLPREDE